MNVEINKNNKIHVLKHGTMLLFSSIQLMKVKIKEENTFFFMFLSVQWCVLKLML